MPREAPSRKRARRAELLAEVSERPPVHYDAATEPRLYAEAFAAHYAARYQPLPRAFADEAVHAEVSAAVRMLHDMGIFGPEPGAAADTARVLRVSFGEPGLTHCGGGHRTFAHPWRSFGPCDDGDGVAAALERVRRGGGARAVAVRISGRSQAGRALRCLSAQLDSAGAGASCDPEAERRPANMALLNLLPGTGRGMRAPENEPYYGMGPLALPWHKDGGIEPDSPIAGYTVVLHGAGIEWCAGQAAAGGEEGATAPAHWRMGLKVAWRVDVPAVAAPLLPGEGYVMQPGFNSGFRHCVLAGEAARVSSTHRVLPGGANTWQHIDGRSATAVSIATRGGETTAAERDEAAQTHTEVEFGWIRQFWALTPEQRAAHRWWRPRIAVLEARWLALEQWTARCIDADPQAAASWRSVLEERKARRDAAGLGGDGPPCFSSPPLPKVLVVIDCDRNGEIEAVDPQFVGLLEGRCQRVSLADALAGAAVDGVLSCSHAPVDGELLDALTGVKVVSNYGVGVDHINVAECAARGVVVGNTPGVLTDATADFAWALLLAAARRVVEGHAYATGPEYTYYNNLVCTGRSVSGKTIGIVGLGRIGEAVARRATGFSMRIVYTGRSRKVEAEAATGAVRVPLDGLLAEADYVVLTCPLSADTTGLIGARELALMKPTATLCNISRGPVVDTAALTAALQEGRLGMAALDVFDPEPLPRDHPLLSMRNVVMAPHRGSATVEARRAMAELAIENLLRGCRGEALLNEVRL